MDFSVEDPCIDRDYSSFLEEIKGKAGHLITKPGSLEIKLTCTAFYHCFLFSGH